MYTIVQGSLGNKLQNLLRNWTSLIHCLFSKTIAIFKNEIRVYAIFHGTLLYGNFFCYTFSANCIKGSGRAAQKQQLGRIWIPTSDWTLRDPCATDVGGEQSRFWLTGKVYNIVQWFTLKKSPVAPSLQKSKFPIAAKNITFSFYTKHKFKHCQNPTMHYTKETKSALHSWWTCHSNVILYVTYWQIFNLELYLSNREMEVLGSKWTCMLKIPTASNMPVCCPTSPIVYIPLFFVNTFQL